MQKKNLTIKETFSLAFKNHKKNNLSIAEKFYMQVLKINPSHFDSIFYLASLLAQVKNFDAARELFEKAIHINPNYDIAYANLGAVLKELGKFKEAVNACEKAILISPKNLEAQHNLALALQELGEIKKAINCFDKLSKIQPNPANAYQNLGKLYVMLGKRKEAINSYQLATKHDPKNLSYYYNLSDLDEKILDTNLKKKIDEIIKKNYYKKKNLAYANFLLSKYELKKKNYEKEFNYLLEGHINYFDARKKIFEKGINYWLQVLPKLIELENIDLPSVSNKKENYKIKPIFIVGVPRCGSTLVEKIIASGEKYMAIGEETGIVSYVVGEKVNKKESIVLDIENFRKEVINNYEEWGLLKKKYDYTFTDKSLDNFFFIGLIKIIFPFAKIINCKRNPLSAIMSIIKNNLGQVSWAHNLENIFKFFDIYHKKIETFKKMYPNYIYELQYEDLVVDPVSESKKLMKFCEIPWNKKCLEYYKRKDMVSHTASTMQIRKPIYVDSFKKHIHYKKFLDKYGKKYSWFN